jgi:RND family efflux transporter MFP subunit
MTDDDSRIATRQRWRGRLLAGVALVILLGGLGVGAWSATMRSQEVMKISQEQRDMVPHVLVAPVRASSDDVVVTLPATTLAFSVANLFARASGYISSRQVDIGDSVKKNQLIVEITAPELDHQITQAEATLGQLQAAVRQAEANLELARVTWARDKPLVKEGWAPQQQGTIDVQTQHAQEAALGVAQANVAAQQAQLNVLHQQKAYQRVVAPFDGVITQRNVDVGTLVQADTTTGTFLFTLMDSSVIRAQVFVPQSQAIGLAPGVKATLRVPEIPGRTFAGTVTRMADALQPDTRTLLTEVDIPNPDGALTPGTYGSIELHIPRKAPGLVVPAAAIIFNRDGVQTAVVEDGIVHIRKLEVARDFGTEVEVRTGVRAGDLVVLNPAVDLAEGARVNATQKPQTPR